MAEGIVTMYDGFRCRSRLEATWAAMFDLLGWDYDYEPFDLPGWIPDFILKGARPVLIEVKPVIRAIEVPDEIDKILRSAPPYPVALVGCGLTAPHDFIGEVVYIPKGAEPFFMNDPEEYGGLLDYLASVQCHQCGSGWAGFLRGLTRCGNCGVSDVELGEERDLSALWAQAKNRVQWRAR